MVYFYVFLNFKIFASDVKGSSLISVEVCVHAELHLCAHACAHMDENVCVHQIVGA